MRFNTDETIAAISTPVGEGGIGIVRLSGNKALSIADRVFVSKDGVKPSESKTYTMRYGHIVCPASGTPWRPGRGKSVDEVILTVMRSPKSYTKEDVVEINCHGGVMALRKVLDLVLCLGARLAEPGEFTKRAFINGRIDLTQAEAVLDIIKAKTESSMRVALAELEGEFSRKINSLKEKVLVILSEAEARIDFSEEDIELMPGDEMAKRLTGVSHEIKKLIDDAWKGMILKEGVLCVISGKPNAGKSSLMNVLLKRNRVIVTPVPGTTRDAIEEEISLNGVPVRIVDTAGISTPKGLVEKHGIQKSKSYIKRADLIIFMLDLSKKWSRADEDIFNSIKGKNFIIIANKSDLPGKLDLKKVKKRIGENKLLKTTLFSASGTRRVPDAEKVEEAILRKVWQGEVVSPEGAFVTNLRHKRELGQAGKRIEKAISALSRRGLNPVYSGVGYAPEIVASDLREAVYFLGSILGDTVEPDILGKIFSRFCVGK